MARSLQRTFPPVGPAAAAAAARETEVDVPPLQRKRVDLAMAGVPKDMAETAAAEYQSQVRHMNVLYDNGVIQLVTAKELATHDGSRLPCWERYMILHALMVSTQYVDVRG